MRGAADGPQRIVLTSCPVSYAWPTSAPTSAHSAAYADAPPRPYWLEALPRRTPHAPLQAIVETDLCIIIGGKKRPGTSHETSPRV